MKSIKSEILSDIKKARYSIKIAVAWLTDIDFIDALSEKIIKDRRMDIRIVVSGHKDNKDFYLKTKLVDLNKMGVKVKTYGSSSPLDGGFMHCKFYIIDEDYSKSGSYNWSKGAEKNIECLDLVDVNDKKKLFLRLFGNGSDYVR